ncbi:MAG: hypothetical protein ACOX7K_08815 [Oscillospiraceae bacterium]|jgi:hypothetical protein
MSCDCSQLATLAALEWIAENTTIEVDLDDPEVYYSLPARARLFVTKFGELMNRQAGVASQSIEGLSMSFDTTDQSASIWGLANSLLGDFLKSQVKVTPARRRW